MNARFVVAGLVMGVLAFATQQARATDRLMYRVDRGDEQQANASSYIGTSLGSGIDYDWAIVYDDPFAYGETETSVSGCDVTQTCSGECSCAPGASTYLATLTATSSQDVDASGLGPNGDAFLFEHGNGGGSSARFDVGMNAQIYGTISFTAPTSTDLILNSAINLSVGNTYLGRDEIGIYGYIVNELGESEEIDDVGVFEGEYDYAETVEGPYVDASASAGNTLYGPVSYSFSQMYVAELTISAR